MNRTIQKKDEDGELKNLIINIQSEEKAVHKSFIQIGKYLKYIHENELYKTLFSSWKEFIKSNFQFRERYSYRMIQIVSDKDLLNRQDLGITKLIELLIFTPEEREELLESELSPEELSKLDEDQINHLLLDKIEDERELKSNSNQNPSIKLRDLPVTQFKKAIRKKAIENKIITPDELLMQTQSDMLNYLGKFESMVIDKKEIINSLDMKQKEELAKVLRTLVTHLNQLQTMIVRGIS